MAATSVSNTVSGSVSIEKYLETNYRPDLEYIDGELRERPVVVYAHGRLQILIGVWFEKHEQEWHLEAAAEVRTRVSPTRVRLPDVVVCHTGPQPGTLVDPPLIVIEILSPGDSYAETQKLAVDYQKMEIPNIWIIDPETRTGRVCKGDDWIGVRRFEVAGTEIYMDLEDLFARLDRSSLKS